MDYPFPHPKIYLISGLGGDERLFLGLRELGLQFETLPYLRPHKKESLQAYAKRIAEPIPQGAPFIVGGVSFGGILSVEIAKQMNPEKVILISSIKHKNEFPYYLKTFRYFPLHRLVSGEFLKKMAPMESAKTIGNFNRGLLDAQRDDADPALITWAVHKVLWYRNTDVPERIVHIHGEKDPLFPHRFIQNKVIIPEGSHVMVLNRPAVVFQEIVKVLKEERSR